MGNENNDNKKGIGIVNVFLILIIIMLIMAIIGLFIYFNFIKSENTNILPTENNITQNEIVNNKEKDKIVKYEKEKYEVKTTLNFVNSDNKTELSLIPQTDAMENATEYNIYATYTKNSKKAIIKGNIYKNGKYLIFDTILEKNDNKCEFNTSFILDSDTKKIVNLKEDMIHEVYHINDNYYLTDSNCISGTINIYNEKLERVGSSFLGNNDSYYYLLDDNIIKYDIKGNIVSKSEDVYRENSNKDGIHYFDSIVLDNVLYIVINNNDDVYFVDTSDFSALILGTKKDLNYGGNDFHCLETEENLIKINFGKDIKFIYNPKTKSLSK